MKGIYHTEKSRRRIVVTGSARLDDSFVVLRDRKPLFAVECKSGERGLSPAIRYFAARTTIPRFFQVHLGDRHFETGTTTVLPFRRFCRELSLP